MGIIADEDVDAIAIEGERQAILREQLLEDDGVAVQILRGAEVQGQHGVGGVVDGAMQGHRRPAGAEPGKGTGIDLDELPHARLRRAAMPMHPGPPPVLGGQAQGPASPPHQFAADAQALHLAQLLGGVAVIEILVAGSQQGVDLRRHRLRQAARGRPAAAAVWQARRPLGPQARFQPLDVPRTQAAATPPLARSSPCRRAPTSTARPGALPFGSS